jgi:hypothetical protein
MSEELEQNNDGTWSGLKKTIIGVVTTAVMGLGTWGVTLITGGDKEESAPVQQAAPVINITNSNQQAQQSSGGGTKVIERVVEKPAAQPVAKPKKKEGDEFKEEAPKW